MKASSRFPWFCQALSPVLLAATVLTGASVHGALIVNPGFDLPGSVALDAGNVTQSTTIPGWVLNGLTRPTGGGGSVEVLPITSTFGSGINFARLIHHSVLTTRTEDQPAVTPGQELMYSFDFFGNSSGSFRNMAFLRWFDADHDLISSVNLMPSNLAGFTGATLSGTAVVPAGATSVGFSFSGTFSAGGGTFPFRTMLIDNVNLSVVPEPSTSLCFVGMGAMALLRRRRGQR